MKTSVILAKDIKDEFGISKNMTTFQYIIWLESKKGIKFLKSIENSNRNFGDYWTMHEAKSLIISQYAKFANK